MSHFLIAPLYLFNYFSLLELFSSASDMSCWTGLDPVINVIANIWTLGITKSFLNEFTINSAHKVAVPYYPMNKILLLNKR